MLLFYNNNYKGQLQMGNNSSSGSYGTNPTLTARLIETEPGLQIYQNQEGEEFERYAVPCDPNHETTYEFRINNLHPQLVDVLFAGQPKGFTCNSPPYLIVVTERIPYRLMHLPAQQLSNAVTILQSSLQGFKDLFRVNGILCIRDSMIGISSKNKVKVWLNPNFAVNTPEPNPLSFKSLEPTHHEKEMVQNLFDLINSKAENNSTWRQLMRARERRSIATFDEAIALIDGFVEAHNLNVTDEVRNPFNKNLQPPQDDYESEIDRLEDFSHKLGEPQRNNDRDARQNTYHEINSREALGSARRQDFYQDEEKLPDRFPGHSLFEVKRKVMHPSRSPRQQVEEPFGSRGRQFWVPPKQVEQCLGVNYSTSSPAIEFISTGRSGSQPAVVIHRQASSPSRKIAINFHYNGQPALPSRLQSNAQVGSTQIVRSASQPRNISGLVINSHPGQMRPQESREDHLFQTQELSPQPVVQEEGKRGKKIDTILNDSFSRTHTEQYEQTDSLIEEQDQRHLKIQDSPHRKQQPQKLSPQKQVRGSPLREGEGQDSFQEAYSPTFKRISKHQIPLQEQRVLNLEEVYCEENNHAFKAQSEEIRTSEVRAIQIKEVNESIVVNGGLQQVRQEDYVKNTNFRNTFGHNRPSCELTYKKAENEQRKKQKTDINVQLQSDSLQIHSQGNQLDQKAPQIRRHSPEVIDQEHLGGRSREEDKRGFGQVLHQKEYSIKVSSPSEKSLPRIESQSSIAQNNNDENRDYRSYFQVRQAESIEGDILSQNALNRLTEHFFPMAKKSFSIQSGDRPKQAVSRKAVPVGKGEDRGAGEKEGRMGQSQQMRRSRGAIGESQQMRKSGIRSPKSKIEATKLNPILQSKGKLPKISYREMRKMLFETMED